MDSTSVTLTVRGTTALGEVIAVVGSCETLGSWCHQKAVTLQPAEDDGTLWRTTIQLPRGSETRYRYFKGFILESKTHHNLCDECYKQLKLTADAEMVFVNRAAEDLSLSDNTK